MGSMVCDYSFILHCGVKLGKRVQLLKVKLRGRLIGRWPLCWKPGPGSWPVCLSWIYLQAGVWEEKPLAGPPRWHPGCRGDAPLSAQHDLHEIRRLQPLLLHPRKGQWGRFKPATASLVAIYGASVTRRACKGILTDQTPPPLPRCRLAREPPASFSSVPVRENLP